MEANSSPPSQRRTRCSGQ